MTDDVAMARLTAAAYDPDYTDWHFQGVTDGVWWAISYEEPITRLIFRGSADPLDWERDFNVSAWLSHEHPRLGLVHAGFLTGMDLVYAQVRPLVKHHFLYIGGHSLGAARTTIIAGMFVDGGFPGTIRRICFGEPKTSVRSGYRGLIELVQDHHVSSVSFRNTDGRGFHDEVTDLPPMLYSHPTPLRDIVIPNAPKHRLRSPFQLHHMSLYLQAVEALP